MSEIGDPVHDVVVQTRGEVSATERAYAKEKVTRVQSFAPGPVLFARVELSLHADPARERPAFAKAELDVDGRLVRAHIAASTMFEAIDLLEARLRERMERFAHTPEAKRLRLRDRGEHEWRHGDPTRSTHHLRPVEERQIVRHKTFAVGEMTPGEAVLDLELLDHDFYLFTNRETGEDNVLARTEAGGYELLELSLTCSLAEGTTQVRPSATKPPTLSIEDAVQLLDLGESPFVFFVDPTGGRGQVLYRRYDGHYGLIVPAESDHA